MQQNICVQPSTTIINKTGDWRTFKPKFLYDKCVACGICQNICPEGVISQTSKTNSSGKMYYDCDYNYCKGCGLCAEECPSKAIVMEVEKK
ncbi:MAG: 4Fe-4S binding protein [Patescibacteria group bacterium]